MSSTQANHRSTDVGLDDTPPFQPRSTLDSQFLDPPLDSEGTGLRSAHQWPRWPLGPATERLINSFSDTLRLRDEIHRTCSIRPTPTPHQSHSSRPSSTHLSLAIAVPSPSLTPHPPSPLFTARSDDSFGDDDPDTTDCTWFARDRHALNLRASVESSVASSTTTNDLRRSRSKTPSTRFSLEPQPHLATRLSHTHPRRLTSLNEATSEDPHQDTKQAKGDQAPNPNPRRNYDSPTPFDDLPPFSQSDEEDSEDEPIVDVISRDPSRARRPEVARLALQQADLLLDDDGLSSPDIPLAQLSAHARLPASSVQKPSTSSAITKRKGDSSVAHPRKALRIQVPSTSRSLPMATSTPSQTPSASSTPRSAFLGTARQKLPAGRSLNGSTQRSVSFKLDTDHSIKPSTRRPSSLPNPSDLPACVPKSPKRPASPKSSDSSCVPNKRLARQSITSTTIYKNPSRESTTESKPDKPISKMNPAKDCAGPSPEVQPGERIPIDALLPVQPKLGFAIYAFIPDLGLARLVERFCQVGLYWQRKRLWPANQWGALSKDEIEYYLCGGDRRKLADVLVGSSAHNFHELMALAMKTYILESLVEGQYLLGKGSTPMGLIYRPIILSIRQHFNQHKGDMTYTAGHTPAEFIGQYITHHHLPVPDELVSQGASTLQKYLEIAQEDGVVDIRLVNTDKDDVQNRTKALVTLKPYWRLPSLHPPSSKKK